MASVEKHVVAFPFQAWGHARPLINLAARLVKLRPVHVTYITTNAFCDRVKAELARSFDPDEDEYAKRVRVVSLGDVEFLRPGQDGKQFTTMWKALIGEEEVVCLKEGSRYEPWPKPKATIIDAFAIDPFNTIRELSGNTVKVFTWFPGTASAIFHLFGPVYLGGKGNLRLLAEEEVRKTGKPYKEVVHDLIFKPKGKLVHVPGTQPMYDHEYHPQDFPFADDMGHTIFPRTFETLEKTDGLFVFTPEAYEPEAVAAVKGWFAETNRPAYACGPLLPSASTQTAAENEKNQSNEASEIQDFLDTTLKNSGERSLVYISFGSIFWPAKTPEKIWEVLDVIMDMNIPFILSHASPFAVVPDEIKEKLKAYGKGLLSPWTPQQLILDHPVTGWFVAHGGQGGVTEALSAGVPQILWPFGGDQPVNALHISEGLQVGYELLEVRSGHGLKPLYRTGKAPAGTSEALKAEVRDVLTRAFGEDGAKKREKLQVLRKAVLGAWEDGGSSKTDVLAFLDSI